MKREFMNRKRRKNVEKVYLLITFTCDSNKDCVSVKLIECLQKGSFALWWISMLCVKKT
jgi:hypothetical protein